LRTELTLVGPCIVIYFYSKTNQTHNISNLFYFGTTLYMFRTVSPSIIRSLRLYIQHHNIQVLWLLANQLQNLYGIVMDRGGGSLTAIRKVLQGKKNIK